MNLFNLLFQRGSANDKVIHSERVRNRAPDTPTFVLNAKERRRGELERQHANLDGHAEPA